MNRLLRIVHEQLVAYRDTLPACAPADHQVPLQFTRLKHSDDMVHCIPSTISTQCYILPTLNDQSLLPFPVRYHSPAQSGQYHSFLDQLTHQFHRQYHCQHHQIHHSKRPRRSDYGGTHRPLQWYVDISFAGALPTRYR